MRKGAAYKVAKVLGLNSTRCIPTPHPFQAMSLVSSSLAKLVF